MGFPAKPVKEFEFKYRLAQASGNPVFGSIVHPYVFF
jgi:hypothetical protein